MTQTSDVILELEDAAKFYPSRERKGEFTAAFQDVSLEIREHETVTIVGASGCGKTSLLRTVAGLDELSAGRVNVRGAEKPDDQRAPVAMVFQRDALFPWRTIHANVALGLEVAGIGGEEQSRRVSDALRLVRLSRWANHFPHELSGGMRQRVNIARALVTRPRLLLMDEPFAALDAQTREVMQEELRKLITELGITVMFVTHQIDEAVYLGDRVVVLGSSPGRVQAIVSPDLPRPRVASVKRSEEFTSATEHVWSLISADVTRALESELQAAK
jgi:NitT/TauT family transport system ATP-binding protein